MEKSVGFLCGGKANIYCGLHNGHMIWLFRQMQNNLMVQNEGSWNVMAHAQKPDFVFRRNGRLHLNRRRATVQSTTGSRGVRISGSNAGYAIFRGSAKGTGYPLHSAVPLSLPPCASLCAITFRLASTSFDCVLLCYREHRVKAIFILCIWPVHTWKRLCQNLSLSFSAGAHLPTILPLNIALVPLVYRVRYCG